MTAGRLALVVGVAAMLVTIPSAAHAKVIGGVTVQAEDGTTHRLELTRFPGHPILG